MTTVTQLLVAAAKYAFFVFILRCIVVYSYRVTLHPLSRYPGPFLAKLSDWYAASNALRMRLHITTYFDHQKYGPVVRQGPNKLVFNTTTALRDIYQNPRIIKHTSYLVLQLKPNTFNIVNVLDKRQHRIKRRLIGQCLSESTMRKFEPTMTSHIDTFVKLLIERGRSQANSPTNMSKNVEYLGADIIGTLALGTSMGCQQSSKHRFMSSYTSEISLRANTYMQFPLLQKACYHWMPWVFPYRFRYLFRIRSLIKARMAEGAHAKDDMLSFLVDAKDPETGTKLSLEEIWFEALVLFPAGSDTTSTCISALFFYLSRYPECYERLCKEVRTTFTSGAEIQSGPKLASCTYLRACIDESLRMSPPAPTHLWRTLAPGDKEPLVIDGHVVPPGTAVSVNIYAIHHNEEYFRDPFVFDPARFLAADETYSAAEKKSMHDAFTPFSIGSRGCAGKAMAYMEASLVIAKTLWYMDFERPKGTEDEIGAGGEGKGRGRGRAKEFQLYEHFSARTFGPNLVVKPRGDFWKEL